MLGRICDDAAAGALLAGLAAAAFLAAHFALRCTRYGRYVLAVGGNEEVARLSGIATRRVKTVTYLLSASGAAATGLFLAARMNVGDPLVGAGFDLDAVASVPGCAP